MHKAFISYHHGNDQHFKNHLSRMNQFHSVFIDRSVRTGDISDQLDPQTIRAKIRDEWLRDTTVTVLLVGSETKYRKHVDWELKSSMINGRLSKRSGILVITLPYINCSSWHTAFPYEKEIVYPECKSWCSVTSKDEYERRYPYLPARIIDNLRNPMVKMAVVPWSKIEASPRNLEYYIRMTSEARYQNEYDLSRKMRMRNGYPLEPLELIAVPNQSTAFGVRLGNNY